MRILYLLAIINIALIIPGCATTNTHPHPQKKTTTTKTTQLSLLHHKDPISVSILTTKKPNKPYIVLGKATVSKYNVVGIKRQEATVRDIIRQQAATLGGDAVINIKHDEKSISATVIGYKHIIV